MHITVDEADGRPIYRQIADELKALIARGELAEGAQLPPVRQLAGDLGVNLNTVAIAYRELQAEGLLNVRHGAGATVAARDAGRERPSEEELRKPVRAALTGLVLAGLQRTEIMALVGDELRALLKGAK
ncbi:MAG TPA: GntR family transcriptional regulator [Pyrinomonadaceae bacterium]|nr:GntR family transcriptional regulator [Pyrinomonadaceae bacterium]